MLVFRRTQGESFQIGDSVEVKILEISRRQVKIGVVAPGDIGIYRTEIAQMNRRAVVADPKALRVRSAAEALRQALRHRVGKSGDAYANTSSRIQAPRTGIPRAPFSSSR